MDDELKEVILEVRDSLPKGVTYSDIVKRSGNRVSLSQVKKLFSLKDISFEQAEKVVKYSWMVIRENKDKLEKLKKYRQVA